MALFSMTKLAFLRIKFTVCVCARACVRVCMHMLHCACGSEKSTCERSIFSPSLGGSQG